MKEFKDTRLMVDLARNPQGAQDGHAFDLNLLADQLIGIAKELRQAETAQHRPAPRPRTNTEDTTLTFAGIEVERARYAEIARKAYEKRRSRTTIFGNPELFGEPAWDILLDLYIAHSEGKPVSVSSACIGSASPPTTGLRWLGVLAESGLILREHDREDQRRVLVRLTEHGLAAMDEYFARAIEGS